MDNGRPLYEGRLPRTPWPTGRGWGPLRWAARIASLLAHPAGLGTQVLGYRMADVGQNIFEDGAGHIVRVIASEPGLVFDGFRAALHPLRRDVSRNPMVSNPVHTNAHIAAMCTGRTPSVSGCGRWVSTTAPSDGSTRLRVSLMNPTKTPDATVCPGRVCRTRGEPIPR
jgi:hypothetical protein